MRKGRKSDYGKNMKSVCCVFLGIIGILSQLRLFNMKDKIFHSRKNFVSTTCSRQEEEQQECCIYRYVCAHAGFFFHHILKCFKLSPHQARHVLEEGNLSFSEFAAEVRYAPSGRVIQPPRPPTVKHRLFAVNNPGLMAIAAQRNEPIIAFDLSMAFYQSPRLSVTLLFPCLTPFFFCFPPLTDFRLLTKSIFFTKSRLTPFHSENLERKSFSLGLTL